MTTVLRTAGQGCSQNRSPTNVDPPLSPCYLSAIRRAARILSAHFDDQRVTLERRRDPIPFQPFVGPGLTRNRLFLSQNGSQSSFPDASSRCAVWSTCCRWQLDAFSDRDIWTSVAVLHHKGGFTSSLLQFKYAAHPDPCSFRGPAPGDPPPSRT